MDTLVIAQRADWLQSYLHCWSPAAESQRGTKWPTAKIWLSNEVFFRACLFFWKLQEPSSKGNTAPVKSGTVFFKIQHVLNVAFWASGLCERLCLIYGALNLQHVSFGPETQSTVNPTLLSLRRCNSHTSTCHLCWQAAYLEKSIRYPASVTPPQAFQKQTAKAANLY